MKSEWLSASTTYSFKFRVNRSDKTLLHGQTCISRVCIDCLVFFNWDDAHIPHFTTAFFMSLVMEGQKTTFFALCVQASIPWVTGMSSSCQFWSQNFWNDDLLILEKNAVVKCQFFSVIPIFLNLDWYFSPLWPTNQSEHLKHFIL